MQQSPSEYWESVKKAFKAARTMTSSSTGPPQDDPAVEQSSTLYRMVGPGRFAPVPRRPLGDRLLTRMKNITWRPFAAGLAVGLVVGFAGSYAFAGKINHPGRFTIVSVSNFTAFKMDTSTGQCWWLSVNENVEHPISSAQPN
jgi:hypothetical protein